MAPFFKMIVFYYETKHSSDVNLNLYAWNNCFIDTAKARRRPKRDDA